MRRIKRFYSFIAMLLLVTVFASSFPQEAFANTLYDSTNKSDIVYVDGIPFNVEIDDNYNIIVSTNYESEYVEFTYSNNETSSLVITTDTGIENYELYFNELNEDNYDVDIYKDGVMVDSINENLDSYIEQAVAIPMSALGYYLFSLAVSVIVVKEAADAISVLTQGGTVTDGFYEYENAETVAKAIAKDNSKKGKFYPAIISDNDECTLGISPKAIDRGTAITWIKAGGCIYTYSPDDAYSILNSSGLGAVQHDYHDNNGLKKGIWFKHYHPAQAKYHYSHVFYGVPRVNK